MAEQRKTERIFTRVPVRIRGVDEFGKTFSEDTATLEINRDGARVALRNVPLFGAKLEITNLSKNLTAASLVTRRCAQSYSGLPEWGLEFSRPTPDFWGITFEESKNKLELVVSALLACKACARKELANLSPVEYERLGEEYFISRSCPSCGKSTNWEVVARDEEPVSAPGLAPPESLDQEVGEERRRVRRLTLKAPILLNGPRGASETLQAQDVSRLGLSFTSSLELEPGDRVQVSVGHGVAEAPSVRQCLVIWRRPSDKNGRFFYGVKFLDSE